MGNIDEAVSYLLSEFEKNAPIDGVFAFSQGSNLTFTLSALAVHGKGVPLAFVIHDCGGIPAYTERYPELFKEPLQMPSLFISGDADFVTDESGAEFLRPGMEASKLYLNPEKVTHSGPHQPLPRDRNESKALAANILAFMERASISC